MGIAETGAGTNAGTFCRFGSIAVFFTSTLYPDSQASTMPLTIVAVSSAEDLIAALRPQDPRWTPNPSDWIFRGQRNSLWGLLPTALRPNSWKGFVERDENPLGSAEQGTIVKEYIVLRTFGEALDRSGFEIPNGIFLPQMFEDGPVGLLTFPMDPAVLIFVALAQHHGVPTRLLDWTRIGLNAAYFSAAGAAKHADADEDKQDRVELMSVWAFRSQFAKWADDNLGVQNSPGAPAVRVVTAPRSSNANLHAQSGVFTESSLAPLETIVAELIDRLDKAAKPWLWSSPLIRFDLPTAEAPKLLRLLSDEQIDAARMFPGRDGVVHAMKERVLWYR
jgi:hypothetical protein